MPNEEPSPYRIPLSELEASAHVDPADVITEQPPESPTPDDDSVGHLPGNVRPFAV